MAKKVIEVILVATDFSPAAEAALDEAIGLASALGAKIYLLHAYVLPAIGVPDGPVGPLLEIATRVIADAERELAASIVKRKEASADGGVLMVPLLEEADPQAAILAAAEDVSADLVVMGTHGRRGIVRALIGSVAEAVVRRSRVPVLTVHAPE